jgi:hypothetical protein
MKKEHLNLWQKIATFKLDDPQAARPFSKKLAEEQKWTEDFTQRVIAEYKKFAFLCVTLPNGASPSSTVDEAWHLHLTYTDSYWNQFCPKILGTQLHHHPSKGGSGEHDKHVDWYRQTLIGYVEIFGQLPPDDIWTIPFNFDPSQYLPENSPFLLKNFENTEGGTESNENDISTEKKTFGEYFGYALEVILLLALLMPTLLKGLTFLIPFSLLGITIAVMIAEHHARHKEALKNRIQGLEISFSPYFGAWIAGGKERLLTSFLYEATSNCTFQPATNSITFQLKNAENLYENPLYASLETVERSEVSLNFIKESVRPYEQLIENQVNSLGFEAKPIGSKIWTTIGLFGAIGFIRMIEGMYFHKPILFLFLTCFVFILALAIVNSVTEMKFQDWRDRFTSHFQTQYATTNGDNIMWQFALGTAAFSMGSNWYGFENSLRPQEHKNNGGDGGSSSGCSSGGDGDGGGGGSCGGGCGGCGGGCGS